MGFLSQLHSGIAVGQRFYLVVLNIGDLILRNIERNLHRFSGINLGIGNAIIDIGGFFSSGHTSSKATLEPCTLSEGSCIGTLQSLWLYLTTQLQVPGAVPGILCMGCKTCVLGASSQGMPQSIAQFAGAPG